jgi:translation initiation factor RLI1
MNKSTAIELLGGSVKDAAEACQISRSAISQWPDELTKDQVDRVQAALYRKAQSRKGKKTPVIAQGA